MALANTVFDLTAQPWQTGKRKTERKIIFISNWSHCWQGHWAAVRLIFRGIYLPSVIHHELIGGIRKGPNGAQKICPLFYFLTDFMIQVFSIYKSNAYLQKICQHDKVRLKYENSSHAPALRPSHVFCHALAFAAVGAGSRSVWSKGVKKKKPFTQLPTWQTSRKELWKQLIFLSHQTSEFPSVFLRGILLEAWVCKSELLNQQLILILKYVLKLLIRAVIFPCNTTWTSVVETLRKNTNTRRFRIKIPRVSYCPTDLQSFSLCIHSPGEVRALPHVGSVIQQARRALRCMLSLSSVPELELGSPAQGWEAPSASFSQLVPERGADFPKPAA